MSKITQHDAIKKALLARGYKIDENSRSTKYVHFIWTPTSQGARPEDPIFSRRSLWLGKMGSLRRGDVVTRSVPVNSAFHNTLLGEGGYGNMRGPL